METLEPGEAVAALAAAGEVSGEISTENVEEGGPPAFSEAAEASFLSEARERGEIVAPANRAANGDDDAEVGNGKPLPKLEELVNRIPPGLRETLDDLFRAHFVAVRRVPRKVLKT